MLSAIGGVSANGGWAGRTMLFATTGEVRVCRLFVRKLCSIVGS